MDFESNPMPAFQKIIMNELNKVWSFQTTQWSLLSLLSKARSVCLNSLCSLFVLVAVKRFELFIVGQGILKVFQAKKNWFCALVIAGERPCFG